MTTKNNERATRWPTLHLLATALASALVFAGCAAESEIDLEPMGFMEEPAAPSLGAALVQGVSCSRQPRLGR